MQASKVKLSKVKLDKVQQNKAEQQPLFALLLNQNVKTVTFWITSINATERSSFSIQLVGGCSRIQILV